MLLNEREREAAGGRRQHHARVRLSAAQRLGESRRRPALSRRLPDPRLGHDGDAAGRARPRPLHRRGLDAAARSRADGQGRAAALRRRRSIARKAVDPDNYSLTSWHYKRTYQYGSPQFKADGTPGIDRLAPSSAYLSKDGRSVFIGVPGMKPVMQMRVELVARDGGRRDVPGQRVLHALRAPGVRSAGGRFWRSHRGSVAEGRGRRRRPRRSAPRKAAGCISSTAAWRATRSRRTVDLQARSDLERPVRQPAHVRQRGRARDRRRRVPPGIDPRAVRRRS